MVPAMIQSLHPVNFKEQFDISKISLKKIEDSVFVKESTVLISPTTLEAYFNIYLEFSIT